VGREKRKQKKRTLLRGRCKGYAVKPVDKKNRPGAKKVIKVPSKKGGGTQRTKGTNQGVRDFQGENWGPGLIERRR